VLPLPATHEGVSIWIERAYGFTMRPIAGAPAAVPGTTQEYPHIEGVCVARERAQVVLDNPARKLNMLRARLQQEQLKAAAWRQWLEESEAARAHESPKQRVMNDHKRQRARVHLTGLRYRVEELGRKLRDLRRVTKDGTKEPRAYSAARAIFAETIIIENGWITPPLRPSKPGKPRMMELVAALVWWAGLGPRPTPDRVRVLRLLVQRKWQ
jgi:hypothetical protein